MGFDLYPGMKTMKYITGVFAVALILVSLFSADFRQTRQLQMTESISDLNAEDKLPSKINHAFKEGEKLTYRLHYGLMNAGKVVLEVKPDLIPIKGRNVYHIVGTGNTTGATDWVFKVRDRYETYLDKDALIPWHFVRRVDEGGYKFSQDYSFNHYTKKVDVGNNEKMDFPEGIQDMVSAFYSARNLDLSKAKVGDTYSITCFMDKEVWPLSIRFLGREVVDTDLGELRCLKFRPIVQQGRVFKNDEDLTVWISDDKNHLPVRVQADILLGSVKLDITDTENLINPLAKVDD